MVVPALRQPPDDLAVSPPAARLRDRVLAHQLGRYALVGAVCTTAFTVLYLTLSRTLTPSAANTVALVLAALLNTTLNRRHTFGVVGRPGAARHHGQGLLILAVTWTLTNTALAVLHDVAPAATQVVALAVLTVANLGGTGLRFVLLRTWVFRNRQPCAARVGIVRAPSSAPWPRGLSPADLRSDTRWDASASSRSPGWLTIYGSGAQNLRNVMNAYFRPGDIQ